jgi:hypothetical protein
MKFTTSADAELKVNDVLPLGIYTCSWRGIKYSGTSVYALNSFRILGLIPNRTYTEQIFPIRNKRKIINPFP